MSPHNPHEDDQPDAMNQGVHIAIAEQLGRVVCDCGDVVWIEEWEVHCENEGE